MKEKFLKMLSVINDYKGIFTYFIITMMAVLLLSVAAIHLPDFLQNSLDLGTSYITTILLALCGIVTGRFAWTSGIRFARILVIGYAVLTTCYLGYVIFNYGATHAHISAIGFNIGEIINAISVIILVSSLSNTSQK